MLSLSRQCSVTKKHLVYVLLESKAHKPDSQHSLDVSAGNEQIARTFMVARDQYYYLFQEITLWTLAEARSVRIISILVEVYFAYGR